MDLPKSWGTRLDATEAAIREIAERTLGAVRVASRDPLAVLDAVAAFHAALEERFASAAAPREILTEDFLDASAQAAADLLWEAGSRDDPRIAWHLARHGLHRAKREVVEPAEVAAKVRAGLLGTGKVALPGVGTFEARARRDSVRVVYAPHAGEKPDFLGEARVVEVPGLGVFTRRGDNDTVDFEAADAILRALLERPAS